MSFLYKVVKTESPSYLFNAIPNSNTQHQTRNSGNIPSIFVKHDYLKNSFFSSAITEWKIIRLFDVFLKRILNFIRPMPNSIYNIRNHLDEKRIGFSHLKEHKLKHNFQDSIDPMCSCNSGIETHFFSIAQILILKDKPSLTK